MIVIYKLLNTIINFTSSEIARARVCVCCENYARGEFKKSRRVFRVRNVTPVFSMDMDIFFSAHAVCASTIRFGINECFLWAFAQPRKSGEMSAGGSTSGSRRHNA